MKQVPNRRPRRLIALLLCTAALFSLIALVSGCEKEPLETPTPADATVMGEGGVSFFFSATDASGTTAHYEIRTDKATVGEALHELGLIAGEEGPYGLYVKSVCGTTYDYDTHGKYWAFYVNGKLSPTGADTTPITPGESYSFRAE